MAPVLIKDRKITRDIWQSAQSPEAVTSDVPVIVPYAQWFQHRDQWLQRKTPLGVLIAPGEELSTLASDLQHLDLIAVAFPAFTDGRGYSTARLLREQYGFDKEIRAVGDVFKDVLFNLHRVGFDAFLLRAGEDAEDALKALSTFSESYQVSVDQPLPLFRRRLASHG